MRVSGPGAKTQRAPIRQKLTSLVLEWGEMNMRKLKLSLDRAWEVQRRQQEAGLELAEAQRLLGAGAAPRGEGLPKKAEVAHPPRMADASWEPRRTLSH